MDKKLQFDAHSIYDYILEKNDQGLSSTEILAHLLIAATRQCIIEETDSTE